MQAFRVPSAKGAYGAPTTCRAGCCRGTAVGRCFSPSILLLRESHWVPTSTLLPSCPDHGWEGWSPPVKEHSGALPPLLFPSCTLSAVVVGLQEGRWINRRVFKKPCCVLHRRNMVELHDTPPPSNSFPLRLPQWMGFMNSSPLLISDVSLRGSSTLKNSISKNTSEYNWKRAVKKCLSAILLAEKKR